METIGSTLKMERPLSRDRTEQNLLGESQAVQQGDRRF